MTDTSSQPTDPKKFGTRRWVKVVLTLSLALNLLIVGAIGGALWRLGGGPGSDKPGGSVRGDRTSFAIIRALEGSDRRAVLQAARRSANPDVSRAEMRAQSEQLLDILRQPELDLAALATITDARQQSGLNRQQAIVDAWTTRVRDMTAVQRSAYADRLEHLLSKSKRKGKKDR